MCFIVSNGLNKMERSLSSGGGQLEWTPLVLAPAFLALLPRPWESL